MTDWLGRAKAQFSRKRPDGTAITDEIPESSVSSVAPAAAYEERDEVSSVSSAGAVGLCENVALDLAAVAWTDADIARFLDRRARLMRWGWTEPEAEKLAERLVKRDREGDDRVSCTDCRHYRPGRCGNREAAGLNSQEMGRDLAALLQRCAGFTGTAIP